MIDFTPRSVRLESEVIPEGVVAFGTTSIRRPAISPQSPYFVTDFLLSLISIILCFSVCASIIISQTSYTMCFSLFSRPPKRRYSTLYSSSSDEDLPLPPRRKRVRHAPETPHSRYETLKGDGVKRSPPRMVKTSQAQKIQREKVERDVPRRPVTRNSHKRSSQRPAPGRQAERTINRQGAAPPITFAPIYSQNIVPPIDINYHSRYNICNTAPRQSYHRDGYAVRAATNQALRGSVYEAPAPPMRNLRRQPAYGALRYHEVPWQWA
ncbi:hypothetical protein EJ08DRAFT_119186 [Tothia fuscella]|uniref:Uncharacterized protein n=1 Tax=Tothia fuscella TaxID=1048955 RepID=A0A9P4TS85_9PEZI|nr:hypothetical protein EJ08DRAFT_119186 [Tothia fuscella]